MTKLFADLELKKQKMEEMESNEKKRQREEEDAIELKAKVAKEWKQEWEVSLYHALPRGNSNDMQNYLCRQLDQTE